MGAESKVKSIPEKIFALYKETQEDSRRPHLGASLIGHECHRHIWYSFRWVKRTHHAGRILRIFETGQNEEKRVFRNLRGIGYRAGRKQKSFTLHGGHFSGSVDGVLNGNTLLEIKTHNKQSFAGLVKAIPPRHFAQMQVYMGALGLQKGLYFAVCKDNDEIFTAEVAADPVKYIGLVEKAKKIIFMDFPPEKISTDPAFFICKMCDFRDVCITSTMPDRNCRTCAHVTCDPLGGWWCEKNTGVNMAEGVPSALQRIGCSNHRYLPPLIGTVNDVVGDDIHYTSGYIDNGT